MRCRSNTWWRAHTTKDAADLTAMLGWYDTTAHLDALYDRHMDLLIRYDYDTSVANAHRLGRDMVRHLRGEDRTRLRMLLAEPGAAPRLANDMRGCFDLVLPRVEAMYDGMSDTPA